MKPLLYGLQGAIVIVVLVVVFVLIQQREAPEKIAAQVAREWTAESIDGISDAVAQQVTGRIPGLNQIASGQISSQIHSRIAWKYSEARNTTGDLPTGDLYEVIATASAPLEVQLLVIQKKWTISMDFRLLVDTKKKLVSQWTPVLTSFRFTEG